MEVVGWTLLGILVGVVALIVLLLCVPLRVKLEYLETFRVRVYLFGCIRVFSYRADEEKEEEPEEEEPKTTATKSDKSSFWQELKALKQREGVGGVIAFFKQLLSIATGALKRVAHSITIRRLSLFVRVGGEEADAVANNHGRICAVLFPILGALSGVLRIRRKQVVVQPDFLADKTTARMRMIVWVWPFGILMAAIGAMIKFAMVWAKLSPAPKSSSEQPEKLKTSSQ